jgi:hypothetical protein
MDFSPLLGRTWHKHTCILKAKWPDMQEEKGNKKM